MAEEIGFTVRENDLLNRLATGELDDFIGENFGSPDGSVTWLVIQNGVPIQYREAPTEKHVILGDIIRLPGELKIIKEWNTEEEKLEFLRTYSFLINDEAVKNYAKDYRREADGNMPEDSIQKNPVTRWQMEQGKNPRIYSFDSIAPSPGTKPS